MRGALVEVGSIYYGAVQISWSAGQSAGSALNWALETYAPDLYTTIGGTVDQMYQQYQAATSLASQGKILGGVAALFGVGSSQLVPMKNDGGDYGSTETMCDYYGPGGGCRFDCPTIVMK